MTPADTTSTVTVDGLSFGYGRRRVLSSVTLPPIGPGTVTAVIGPNGAGKSTLLRCMAGLHRFDGSVSGPEMLYLPQDPPPASSLTVFESVLLALRRQGSGWRDLRVDAASGLARARRARPTRDRPPHTGAVSGGQRQLVSFALAVVRTPRVMLLDEPTSSLDLHNQLSLLQRISSYAAQQPAAVVLTLHDIGHAARFCDDVVVLHQGTVHAVGPPRDVITESMLRQVYRVEAHVHETPEGTLAIAVTAAT